MLDFPFDFRVADFLTEHGQLVRAKRAYLLCEFLAAPVVCDAFFDSAAPFCVVPYTFSQQLPWQRVATVLTKVDGTASPALSWQGIPCELGVTTLRCVQLTTGVRSVPLQILAKFPRRPAPSSLEREVVLGLSLLDDNDGKLRLERASGTLTGSLAVP